MRRWVETWLARLTERIRELIPDTGWCISEWAICDFQWGDGWWARKGDNRWGAGTARGLNRDQIVKIARLIGCKNFVDKRKKFIFNALVDLKPVERFKNRSDMWGFESLSDSMSKRVLYLLEPVKLTVWMAVIERVIVIKFRMDNGGGMVLTVLKSRYGRIQRSSRMW